MRRIGTFLAALAALLAVPSGAAQADPPRIRSSFTDVCDYIAYSQLRQSWETGTPAADDAYRFLRDDLVRNGVFDLDGDGIAEHVVGPKYMAIMGDYALSSQSPPNYEPWKTPDPTLPPQFAARVAKAGAPGMSYAWLPYQGRFFDVKFSDEGGAFVRDARYFLRGGAHRVACIFSNDVHEYEWTNPEDMPDDIAAEARDTCPPPPRIDDVTGSYAPSPPAMTQLPPGEDIAPSARLSKAAAAGLPVAYAKVPDVEDPVIVSPRRGEFMAPACLKSANASCRDIWLLDFDNDGRQDRLLEMTGIEPVTGCAMQYFVALTRGDAVDTDARQALLMKLQKIGFADGVGDPRCDVAYTWRKRGGFTTLERRGSLPADVALPVSTDLLAHDLSVARGGEAHTLCHAWFHVAPRVVYRAPPRP